MARYDLSHLPPPVHTAMLHLVEALINASSAAPSWCPGCRTLLAAEMIVTEAQTAVPASGQLDADVARVIALLATRRPYGLTAEGIGKHLTLPVQAVVPLLDNLAGRGLFTIASGIDPRFLTYLHGKPFVRYTGLLALAHEHGLVSLKARFTSVTPELALAEAEATFADGKTFGECADSTPTNVPPHIRPHFPRMALTRAKARCLRDALNITLCALEELGEVEHG